MSIELVAVPPPNFRDRGIRENYRAMFVLADLEKPVDESIPGYFWLHNWSDWCYLPRHTVVCYGGWVAEPWVRQQGQALHHLIGQHKLGVSVGIVTEEGCEFNTGYAGSGPSLGRIEDRIRKARGLIEILPAHAVHVRAGILYSELRKGQQVSHPVTRVTDESPAMDKVLELLTLPREMFHWSAALPGIHKHTVERLHGTAFPRAVAWALDEAGRRDVLRKMNPIPDTRIWKLFNGVPLEETLTEEITQGTLPFVLE